MHPRPSTAERAVAGGFKYTTGVLTVALTKSSMYRYYQKVKTRKIKHVLIKGAFHRWAHEYVLKLGPICSRIIK